jgi:broad specificity phosphatase PhoE
MGRVMAPVRIYLIRHAETAWNAEGRFQGTLDSPLSERGVRQTRRLAQALAGAAFAAVYSSPLPRAQVTVRPIAAGRGLAPRSLHAFREINLGIWEGRRVDDVAHGDGENFRLWRERPVALRLPKGETLEEVATRATAGLRELASRHAGETVALMSHGGVNRTVLLSVLGASLEHYPRIRQHNACINVIETDGAAGRVLVLNDIAHLGPDT